MGRVKTIEIDPEKLRAELTKRGLGLKEASEEMGRSRSYMGNCIALRSMPVPAAKMLEMLYNISAESIMPDQIGGGTDGPASGAAGLDMDELRKVIYQECRRAIEEVLNE